MTLTYQNLGFQLRLRIQAMYDFMRWSIKHKCSPITSKQFCIDGKRYPYFVHYYNHTWSNERAVEIPVIWDLVSSHLGKSVLEVGNVLSHYLPVRHDVIDKYERFSHSRVIRKDIINYEPAGKYDLIVSVSTLEHIGWDELPRAPSKLFAALEKICSLLTSNGRAVVSVPVGYNPYLDQAIRTGSIKFTKAHCLQRVSEQNEWIETTLASVLDCKYGEPFPNANGIIFGFLQPQSMKPH